MVSSSNSLAMRWIVLSGLACWLTVCCGCGATDRGNVSGTILHADGSPLALARVIAHGSENGKTAYASTDQNGYYKLSLGGESIGIPPGTYSVYLIEDRGAVEGQMKRTIANKYADPKTSGLSVEVVAGESKVFDITVDPP